jgi:hypothetical protein
MFLPFASLIKFINDLASNIVPILLARLNDMNLCRVIYANIAIILI